MRDICFIQSSLMVSNLIPQFLQKHPEYCLSKYLGPVAHIRDAPSYPPSGSIYANELGVCSPPSSHWGSGATDIPLSQCSSLGSWVPQLPARCGDGRLLQRREWKGLVQRGLWPSVRTTDLCSQLQLHVGAEAVRGQSSFSCSCPRTVQ